jgi:MFS family permease
MLHVMPGMLLLGIGCGMALNPVMLAAMQDVAPEESGLASGVVNTSFMMGGALGLAILASLSERAGYHAAFAVAALCALVAAGARPGCRGRRIPGRRSNMLTKYAGSCHCGEVAFEAEGEIAELLECNCSICSRKGSLLWFIPRDRFRLKTPEDSSPPTSSTGTASITSSASAAASSRSPSPPTRRQRDGRGQRAHAEGIDLSGLPRKQFNGKAL